MVRYGLLYGVLCFATGFVLGTIRELLLIPAFGSAVGRWIEFPLVTLMAVAIGWRLVVQRGSRRGAPSWLAVGAIGVTTLLALESSLALLVLRVPLEAYLESFDISRGALFPIGLAVMLLAPAAVAGIRRQADR